MSGWGLHLVGDGDQQSYYAMWLKTAMAGVGSASKHLRKIFKQTFVAPDEGHSCPGLSGSAKFLAVFATDMRFSCDMTPQEALYHTRAPLAVLESCIRGNTSRPPEEMGNMLLPAAIHDRDFAAVAMLLSLPGMDPNQLMDDMGNTRLMAAIGSADLELVSLLLEQPGIDVRRANAAGDTPIALAMEAFEYPGNPGDNLLWQGHMVLELLNTYHRQGHSYSNVVKDLEHYNGDKNAAWRLCERGLIQHCHLFRGPLRPLQIKHLNRKFKDFSPEQPGIHAAAYSGHIDTVTFLLSLRNQGLNVHVVVRR